MRWGAATAVITLVATLMVPGCFGSQPVGSAAQHFLASTTHPRMVVEIDYQSGKQLRAESVDLLKERFDERLNKPGGITYDQSAVALESHTWTIDDLKAAEKAHRDTHDAVGRASMYVLVVGGGYQADSSSAKVLGVAYTSSSVAIFKDSIEGTQLGAPFPLFSTADVEKAVLVHEAGHLLGLVNVGIKMVTPHEDPDHPGHSTNKGSVMYWAIESSVLGQVLNGAPPTQFDANDIADMQAAGGK